MFHREKSVFVTRARSGAQPLRHGEEIRLQWTQKSLVVIFLCASILQNFRGARKFFGTSKLRNSREIRLTTRAPLRALRDLVVRPSSLHPLHCYTSRFSRLAQIPHGSSDGIGTESTHRKGAKYAEIRICFKKHSELCEL
jgi:hypothetical protein